jgi:lysyl-tRNA synthetase class 2
VISAADPAGHVRRRLAVRLDPVGLPSAEHVLVLTVGLALLVLAPKILRGTKTAVPLAIVALWAISVLHILRPLGCAAATMALVLSLALAFGRDPFPLGSLNRPRPMLVFAATGAWALAYLAVLASPLVRGRDREIRLAVHNAIGRVLHVSLGPPRLSGAWIVLVETLIGCAAAISLLVLRSLLRPAAYSSGHRDAEHDRAVALAERHGEDSLSPFALRPDKSLYFHGDGFLAYRVIGETAVVSGDPVSPPDETARVLAGFRELARQQGWETVVWGASAGTLDGYRALGLRALRAGEEAVVDPRTFTLEGRSVRKLRQSVHRMSRRGWQITVVEGRELDDSLSAEVDRLAQVWCERKRRLIGFAMAMGPYDAPVKPDDVYVLARSPTGELRAAMRFFAHSGKLSLERMHRLEGTPNGLNESLICRALELARDRGVREVSLNYAGLSHLFRDRRPGLLGRVTLGLLSRRFQMERLVCFCEKFSPEWRPRYLVYESRAGLPRVIPRVLQAEGYLPQCRPFRLRLAGRPRLVPRGLRTDAAR